MSFSESQKYLRNLRNSLFISTKIAARTVKPVEKKEEGKKVIKVDFGRRICLGWDSIGEDQAASLWK
jgi:hypothetical protein